MRKFLSATCRKQKRMYSSSSQIFVDHYSILGIPMSSNLKDIQTAYHRLAKRLHPDANRHRNTTQQFADVNIAYSVLTSPMLRKKYDQTFNKMKQNNALNVKMRSRGQHAHNHYKNNEEQRRKNKRRSAGDIGSDRDMEWKTHSEDLYSVYWTDALDAWHLEHHCYLEQIDPWKLKSETP